MREWSWEVDDDAAGDARISLSGIDLEAGWAVTVELEPTHHGVSWPWGGSSGRSGCGFRSGRPSRRTYCMSPGRPEISVFDLADDWVWDFWVVDDLEQATATYHLFFLKAPRSLVDPDLRHWSASIGHAVSTDLTHWTRVDDALVPPPMGSFDDLATWTGSMVRDSEGLWHLFTTGVARAEGGAVQRIGVSTSWDLTVWDRSSAPLLEADSRWYRRRDDAGPDEHWRDPWVMRGADGTWHMYVTAQTPGEAGRGVVGHATSPDLRSWTVTPPLSRATGRFDQLEVISVTEVEGRWVLMFSCLSPEMPGATPGAGGIWTVRVDGPGSPVDIDAAVRLTTEHLYVGKLVQLRQGGVRFLAFENRSEDGLFVGGVIDPHIVTWNEGGSGLELSSGPKRWRP